MYAGKMYLTVLLFVKKENEELFHSYEEKVLPLLQKYNGELLYRIRPEATAFIEGPEELPYEIHLLSFPSQLEFDFYFADEDRKKYAGMYGHAVSKIKIIEGKMW